MTGSIDVEDIADADAAAGPRDPDPRVPVLTALLAATPLPPDAAFVHLYNETWRRAGTDKNAPFPAGSLVAELAARQPAP